MRWPKEILASDKTDLHGLRFEALAFLWLDRVQDRTATLAQLAALSPEDKGMAVAKLQWEVATGKTGNAIDAEAGKLFKSTAPLPALQASLLVSWVISKRMSGDSAGAQRVASRAGSVVWKAGTVDLQPLQLRAASSPGLKLALGDLAGRDAPDLETVRRWLMQPEPHNSP